MVSYGACILGKYPRSDQAWDAIKKCQALPSGENGAALEESYRDDSRSLIRLQKEAKISPIVDGSLPWDDLLKPYTENLDGVKAGGIERWYETNTFYFTPIVTDKIGSNEPILTKYLRITDLKSSNEPWAATMVSPYTFSRLAKNHHYKSTDELMFDLAEIQANDIQALSVEGCAHVHILESEPAVRESLRHHLTEDEIEQWKEALKILVKRSKLPTSLFLCYGDASGLIEYLPDFPVNYLGFDLSRTPQESLTKQPLGKGLLLGALYSDISLRHDLLQEEPAKLASSVQEIVQSSEQDSKQVYLTPNHELSTVSTRTEADLRLKNLGEALRILKGAS